MPQVPRSPRASRAVVMVVLVLSALVAPLVSPVQAGAQVVSLQAFPLEGPCRFYNNFGDYRSPTRSHEGEDIAPVADVNGWKVEPGHDVYAALPGTVEQVWHDSGSTSGAGNGIQLRHGDGTYTRYYHLGGFAPGVATKGVAVSAGQVLGTAGDTGTNPGNYHLHFEIHPGGGAAIDPVPLLQALGGCPTSGDESPGVVAAPPTTPIAVPEGRSGFVAVTPERRLDTRTSAIAGSATPRQVDAGGVVQLSLAGIVPESATAVAVNVTADGPGNDGYLTAYPCGPTVPSTSSLNYRSGGTVPGAVIVGIGENRSVCVLSYAPSDVVVDLAGWFEPVGGASLTPITPTRIHDTRERNVALQPGEVLAVDITRNGAAPADATAVALNVTATEPAAAGYVTAWPCGAPAPLASNLNPVGGTDVANLVTVAVAGGQVCFTSYQPTHLAIDALGWFGTDAGRGALLTPVTPTRVVDTRVSLGGGRISANGTLQFDVRGRAELPADVTAVQATLTVSNPAGSGYITAYPCGPRPEASNLNYTRGAIVANSAQVTLAADGRLCVYSFEATDLILDITGVWRG